MRAVWKVRFPFDGNHWQVPVPTGATILPMVKVEPATGEAFAWFDVDTDASVDLRNLVIVGTGHPIPEEKGCRTEHVASAFDGPYVWHLFEVRSTQPLA